MDNKIYLMLIIALILFPTPCWSLTTTSDAPLRLQVPYTAGIVIESGKVDLKKKLWDDALRDAEKSESSLVTTAIISPSTEELNFGKHDPSWESWDDPDQSKYTFTVYLFNNVDQYWYLSMKCDTELKTPGEIILPFLTPDGKWANFGWVAGDDGDGKGIVYSYPAPGGGMSPHSTTERKVYYNDGKEKSEYVWIWNGLQIPFDQPATAEGEAYTTNIILTFYSGQ